MTSEPDSKPGRRPPTIELKATEVDSPAPAQNTAAPAGEPTAPKEPAPNEPAPEQQAAASPPGRTRPPCSTFAVEIRPG